MDEAATQLERPFLGIQPQPADLGREAQLRLVGRRREDNADDFALREGRGAQDAAAAPRAAGSADGGESGGFAEIVVTASKKADAQNVQEVPFAVTAFGAQQLEDAHVRSLDGLSYSAPNVQLEDVGTAPGYANFSIRGLGINSSIPSIDPTVGVFIDGIYMGISAGILFDTFDLEDTANVLVRPGA